MTSHYLTTIIKKDNATSYRGNIKEKDGISCLDNDKSMHLEKVIQTQETDSNLYQIQTQSNEQLANHEISFYSNNDLNMFSKGQFGTPRIKYDNIQTISLHLDKEQYRNELKTICLQRKESLSQVNHQEKHRVLTKEYESNIIFLNKKEKKIEDLRLEILENEKDQCPFKPILSSQSMKIIKRSKTYNSFTNCYLRNTNWRRRINRKNYHLFALQLSKQFEECKFYPKTNKDIHERVVMQMKKQKLDYVYQKNVKWLNDISNRKKETALEQIEKMINNEQISNKNKKINKKEKRKTSKENIKNINKRKHCSIIDLSLSQSETVNTDAFKNDKSIKKIKHLKTMINDLHNTVENNKKYKDKLNQNDFTQNPSIIKKKDHTYSFTNQNTQSKPKSMTYSSLFNVYGNSLSHRVNNSKIYKHYNFSNHNKDDLNYKCQLLLEKYYKEKKESTSQS